MKNTWSCSSAMTILPSLILVSWIQLFVDENGSADNDGEQQKMDVASFELLKTRVLQGAPGYDKVSITNHQFAKLLLILFGHEMNEYSYNALVCSLDEEKEDEEEEADKD
jgi:hypothetical protein